MYVFHVKSSNFVHLFFPDKEFDDQCKGGYDFMVPKGSTGVQTFHSMAEIASCSYEARKVSVVYTYLCK